MTKLFENYEHKADVSWKLSAFECSLERRIQFEREMVVGEILRDSIIDPVTKYISEELYRPVRASTCRALLHDASAAQFAWSIAARQSFMAPFAPSLP